MAITRNLYIVFTIFYFSHTFAMSPFADLRGYFIDFFEQNNIEKPNLPLFNAPLWAHESKNFTIRIGFVESTDTLAFLQGHTDHLRTLIQLNNGNLLSSSRDETIRIWNLETKTCLNVIKIETGDYDFIVPAIIDDIIQINDKLIAQVESFRPIKIFNIITG